MQRLTNSKSLRSHWVHFRPESIKLYTNCNNSETFILEINVKIKRAILRKVILHHFILISNYKRMGQFEWRLVHSVSCQNWHFVTVLFSRGGLSLNNNAIVIYVNIGQGEIWFNQRLDSSQHLIAGYEFVVSRRRERRVWSSW